MNDLLKLPCGGGLFDSESFSIEKKNGKEYIKAKNKGGASSWNELKDKPFGEMECDVAILEEQTLTGLSGNGDILEVSTIFEIGDTVTVKFNGETFEQVAYNFNDAPVVGNLSLINAGDDSGEPFIAGIFKGRLNIVAEENTATISVSVRKQVIKTLDPKYLPGVEVKQVSILLTTTAKPGYYNNRVTYELTEDLTKGLEYGQSVNFVFTTIASGTAEGTGVDASKSYMACDPVTFSATGVVNKGGRDNKPYISFSDISIPVICDSDANVRYELSGISLYSGQLTAYFKDKGLGDSGYLWSNTLGIDLAIVDAKTVFAQPYLELWSSTDGSSKRFRITVDDSGAISATEAT